MPSEYLNFIEKQICAACEWHVMHRTFFSFEGSLRISSVCVECIRVRELKWAIFTENTPLTLSWNLFMFDLNKFERSCVFSAFCSRVVHTSHRRLLGTRKICRFHWHSIAFRLALFKSTLHDTLSRSRSQLSVYLHFNVLFAFYVSTSSWFWLIYRITVSVAICKKPSSDSVD